MKTLLAVMLLLLAFTVPTFGNDGITGQPNLPRNTAYVNQTLYIQSHYLDLEAILNIKYAMQNFVYPKVSIDLFSYGGSVFEALAIVSVIESWQKEGKTIEITGRGIIASAGLFILVSGTPGYRYLSPQSFVMFHEMQTFKFLSVESVTDQEDQAEIARQIQDRVNKMIASKSKITVEELCERIKKKELWCSPEEAITFGFADKVL